MKIGIIGAGQIGSVLARKFSAVGHTVKLANSRGPETLAGIAADTGATATTVADAVRDVDLVVVTIPLKNVAELPKTLFDGVPDDVVVIDTNNYYPRVRDGTIAAIEQGDPESQWVSEQIGRPVVKVFNNIAAASLASKGSPPGTPGRIALPVSGDDARAKEIVLALVDSIGFDGIDAGSIADSWRQQPGTPVYVTDHDAEGVRKGLAEVDRASAQKERDRSIDEMIERMKAAVDG